MEDIKDIIEILELAKEEIENNDENITATLDLQDLKSLNNLYNLYNKEKQENLALLTRLNADSLLARDNYWKKKITNKVKELDEMSEISNIEREIYNRNEYAIEMLLELLEE